MLTHGHDLGYDGFSRPVDTEDLGQSLQIIGTGLTDAEDGIAEPAHAKTAQLLIKELDA